MSKAVKPFHATLKRKLMLNIKVEPLHCRQRLRDVLFTKNILFDTNLTFLVSYILFQILFIYLFIRIIL